MLVIEFDYELPPDRIAQEPLPGRSGSRMLHLHQQTGGWQDRTFREFADLLRPDDLLVINNTKVFPARLYGRRSGKRAQPLSPRSPAVRDLPHGQIEVLLTRQVSVDPNEWKCLVRPGRRIAVGEKLFFGNANELEADVMTRGDFGERNLRFAPCGDFFAAVERIGHVPLPPYIDREDRPEDRDRYQTVYAQMRGSVAAPTAGLHFTPEILQRIRARGIEIAEVTLHVGLGTFQPIRVETVEDHKLHGEWFEVPPKSACAVGAAKRAGRRVVAAGTTTVRTLEYVASRTGEVVEGTGEADLFIYPGYKFRIVDALLTNFHLPQSTLLMLVCALGGKDSVLRAYRHAVEAGYRFYSYGDCMFLE